MIYDSLKEKNDQLPRLLRLSCVNFRDKYVNESYGIYGIYGTMPICSKVMTLLVRVMRLYNFKCNIHNNSAKFYQSIVRSSSLFSAKKK